MDRIARQDCSVQPERCIFIYPDIGEALYISDIEDILNQALNHAKSGGAICSLRSIACLTSSEAKDLFADGSVNLSTLQASNQAFPLQIVLLAATKIFENRERFWDLYSELDRLSIFHSPLHSSSSSKPNIDTNMLISELAMLDSYEQRDDTVSDNSSLNRLLPLLLACEHEKQIQHLFVENQSLRAEVKRLEQQNEKVQYQLKRNLDKLNWYRRNASARDSEVKRISKTIPKAITSLSRSIFQKLTSR